MRHDELYVAVGAVCPGEGSHPLLGGRNKHHGPFGIRISMISNGPWCYGPSLPPSLRLLGGPNSLISWLTGASAC